MTQIFTSIILTSAVGSALALLLTLLKPLTRKIFSANWHYYMWLIVLFIMIFPIRINIPVQSKTEMPVSPNITLTDNQANINDITEFIDTQPNLIVNKEAKQHNNSSDILEINDILKNMAYIWLAVAIILFLIKITGYLIFIIKMQKHSKIASCTQLKEFTNRKINVRVSNTICSPLMVGIIKPTLLLPDINIMPEHLKNILSHETTHLKRYDILYKWFLSIVKCIHWFNPAIYFISRQINTDCEISCDLSVVKNMNEQAKKGYAETILSLLSHSSLRAVPLTTGMTGNKKNLKKRFYMIKNKINISKKAKIISVILAVILCIGAIFVSGIINGRFNTTDSMLLNVRTDERHGNEFNFLTIGVDNNNKADTIFVFNFDGNILTCMNIPRNVCLSISEDVPIDNGTKSLSALLAEENGDQKVINSIKETLGIPVHYYAKVKMDAIADIADYAGGIEFNVPYDMVYDDPAQDLHINLKEGTQLLNGKQLVHLLRFRDRRHPNGDELRVMTWQSVIKEFLNHAIIENKIGNLAELYNIATKNIKTNYQLNDLKKDFNNLKSINRNNILIKNIRGKNTVLNGYFVFHINYVESKPLLDVFNSTNDGKNLISAITYTNDSLGFIIKVPEKWKSKYEIIQFDNQVAFFHKDIFLKYGKGSGNLFRITKVKQPSEKTLKESGAPYEYLYSGEKYAIVWSVASDVQYPNWQDRDEEDAELAKDFEDMIKDLNFIKGSFSLVDEE